MCHAPMPCISNFIVQYSIFQNKDLFSATILYHNILLPKPIYKAVSVKLFILLQYFEQYVEKVSL